MTVVVSPILSVLVSVLMETLVYGVNVAFFCIAMFLLGNKTSTRRRSPLAYVLVLLFISLTGHVAVQWRRLIDAFYFSQTRQQSIDYFTGLSEITNTVKQYFGVFITLFQDILIVWRLHTVWAKNLYICILPACMVAVTFGTGLSMSNMESRALASDSIFMKKISQFGLAYYIITLCTNLLATILISGRVWFVTRDLRVLGKGHQRLLWRVIIIIVESAAVTAFMQIVHLAFYAQKHPVTYFLQDTTLQIMGLVPTVIVIAVRLGGEDKDAMYSTASGPHTTMRVRNTHSATIGDLKTSSLGTEELPKTLYGGSGLHDAEKQQTSVGSFTSSSSVVV